jgi:hypothetical protein
MLSQNQRKRDIIEAVEARRVAADYLSEASLLIEKAIKKLTHNKSNDVLFDLKQIQNDLSDQIHILRDKENDPI